MTKTPLTIAVFALAVTVAGMAQAHPDRDRGERPDFATLDSNSDGMLSQDELTAPMVARFNEADQDGNGSLSAEEMRAMASARMADRIARRIARADDNGDGELSMDEMAGGRDPAAMFARMDRDDDGMISEAEFDRMAARHGRHRGEGHRGGHHDGKHGDDG